MYLSTVHLVLRLIHGQEEDAKPPEEPSASPSEDDDIPFQAPPPLPRRGPEERSGYVRPL